MYAEISIIKKIFHFFPIIPVYFVIFTVTFSYTKFYFFDDEGFHFMKILSSIIFYLCSIMVLLCHIKSMITSPGFIYEGWENSYKTIYETNPNKNKSRTILSEYDKNLYCQKCSMKRPGRAHHCKICKKCVLKMDHHCPWIANCVGHGNQKFFYQFLFYATIGDLIGFICLFNKVIYLDFDHLSKYSEKKDILSVLINPLILIFSVALAMAMTIAIGFLFIVQSRFLLYNSTTIESRKFATYEESPYYYDKHFFNFCNVMGENLSEWFIPTFQKNIYNNGFYFINPKHQENNENFNSIKNTSVIILSNSDEEKVKENPPNNLMNKPSDLNYIQLSDVKSDMDNTMRIRENS